MEQEQDLGLGGSPRSAAAAAAASPSGSSGMSPSNGPPPGVSPRGGVSARGGFEANGSADGVNTDWGTHASASGRLLQAVDPEAEFGVTKEMLSRVTAWPSDDQVRDFRGDSVYFMPCSP